MSGTELIFVALFFIAIGYMAGWLTKDFRKIFKRFGGILFFFIVYMVVIMILLATDMLMRHENLVLSLAFAGGFVFRLLKRV